MTNQQPQFTIAELGSKFGAQQAQVFGELITLEKIIKSLQTQIEAMTKNEARLVENIQDLEEDISLFKLENTELKEIIEELQSLQTQLRVELTEIKTATKAPAMSAAFTDMAAEGSAIIKEKAAPAEAA